MEQAMRPAFPPQGGLKTVSEDEFRGARELFKSFVQSATERAEECMIFRKPEACRAAKARLRDASREIDTFMDWVRMEG